MLLYRGEGDDAHMITLDWTLAAAAIIFLLTLWALNSLLFRPLLTAVDERTRLTDGARRQAAQLRQQQQEMLETCMGRVKEEKLRGYQYAEEIRRRTLEERQQRLLLARQEAEQRLSAAREELRREVEASRRLLADQAREAADLLASRLLQRA